MSDKFTNGEKWYEMHSLLLGLFRQIKDAVDASEIDWQPMRRPEASWEEAWAEWEAIEALHIESIHEAARHLAHTGPLPCCKPEVLYFLRCRLRAAAFHAGDAFRWKEGRQASMIPFPAVPPSEFIEWLLIEWSDGRSVEIAFPEEACL